MRDIWEGDSQNRPHRADLASSWPIFEEAILQGHAAPVPCKNPRKGIEGQVNGRMEANQLQD
jgi:hypothetical protein